MTTLTISDQSLAGAITHQCDVHFDNKKVTIKDIISSRVQQEVEQYNKRMEGHFYGLIQPSELEQRLNSSAKRTCKEIDAEKQIYVALDAFQKNGFFVFVDDVQVDGLQQVVDIQPATSVSFVKLTPLIGG
ncbi:hypothetical protein [Persicirhabdus sediminis]|uniref:Uncharacterized protein n=1 Tax=Persicirhabdus sediminis TaxID=454144 RepID=A0A8J7MDT9_9BACT|nr:hypothetical protein [Persicirhabdus sediminis]MBK1790822.1 hypothetical protein [Persicirhabdus sediminis]